MKKTFFLLLTLSGVFPLLGQNNNPFSITFDHVALSVTDVDRSAAFYKNVFELEEIANRSRMAGIRWFSLSEGKELHLISTIKEEVKVNKAIHFALKTSEFDDFVRKLASLNIPYSDWPGAPNKITDRADGVRQIFFQDPDGYWIELNSTEK
jgi:catechol 2,3-dioxygenase-like lactoylglutathione lyase family enzyme